MGICGKKVSVCVAAVMACCCAIACGDKPNSPTKKTEATSPPVTEDQKPVKTPKVEGAKKLLDSKETPTPFAKPGTVNAELAKAPKSSAVSGPKGDDYLPPARATLLGTWKCTMKQPLMTLKTNETFLENQLVKSEGNIAFQIPEGPTLNIFVDSESRWNLRDSMLCDVPLRMDLTQTSGEQNVHIDNLLKSMKGQAEARINGKLATCRSIVSLDDKRLVLRVPQKNVDTTCVRKED